MIEELSLSSTWSAIKISFSNAPKSVVQRLWEHWHTANDYEFITIYYVKETKSVSKSSSFSIIYSNLLLLCYLEEKIIILNQYFVFVNKDHLEVSE